MFHDYVRRSTRTVWEDFSLSGQAPRHGFEREEKKLSIRHRGLACKRDGFGWSRGGGLVQGELDVERAVCQEGPGGWGRKVGRGPNYANEGRTEGCAEREGRVEGEDERARGELRGREGGRDRGIVVGSGIAGRMG